MRIVLKHRRKHALETGGINEIPPVFYCNCLFSDLENNAKHTAASTSSSGDADGNL